MSMAVVKILEAEFLSMQPIVHEKYPGVLMIAEESTSWPESLAPTFRRTWV